MDAFGSVGAATSLLVQAFHLFRHVSSARKFAESAGTLSALIAIEYFRFETWLQQSGLFVVDPVSRSLVVSESSLRRAILVAADAQGLTMEYHRVESHVLTVISQVYQCLQALQKLREKYSLQDDNGNADTPSSPSPSDVGLGARSDLPGSLPLFRNPRVAAEVAKDMGLRQRRAKTTSFFRKVTFTWSLKDDTNDRDRVMAHIQTLKSCNDALRELLPQQQRHAADRLINVKALSLSESPSELRGIGGATSSVHNQLHDQIYQAMMVKARRVDESSQDISAKELEEVVLNSATLIFDIDYLGAATGISKRVMARHKTSEHDIQSVILEWVTFPPSLTEEDLELLNERYAILCTLLRSAGHPYFPALPLCTGFFRQSRTSFALVYQLPPFAAPSQPPRSLYSFLPRNKYSIGAEKPSTPSGNNNMVLPSLEQRYELAVALADAVLSLLSVDWMHKTITSHNVVLYQSRDVVPMGNLSRIGFDSPQLLGFGLARRERPGERTIDLRDGGLSPWRFWQHPELRGASGHHRRFEQRFDIFSLGVVLSEIGTWQDAHYYSSSVSESGSGADAGEFRRRLLHVCGREMAHRMGEAYKAAVMACLDGDEIWTGAYGSGEGQEAEEDAMQMDDEEKRGGNLAELFYLHVYSVLRGCCKQAQ
ncbi:hypothetical protein N656DRAFT_797511 [Canariomyces notabilis]|uniref:Protein kinase domain-containing protein n=1 Tax=Canariomyces notabilis TaxID=2074819 RepID=A0AAN6YSN4_9PEZI|nr:hypothetical protein N656DRAFT_797511 [Canariomyces arenarius]